MKLLTVLDRYIIKEIINPFLLGVGGFAVIGIVDIMFVLVETAVSSGVSFLVVLRLLAYKLPAVMILFFPMAVLFSVMLLFVRMAKDNELGVLRTSGITAFRIIIPAIFVTLSISFLSFFINEKLVPLSNTASDNLIKKELRKSPVATIKRNTVFKDGSRFFYIKNIDKQNDVMEQILIFEETTYFPRVITAKSATFSDYKWLLKEGTIQEIDRNGNIEFFDAFDEMRINVEQNIRSYYSQQKKPREMDSNELKEKIIELDKGGMNTRFLKVEYHLKYSLPGMCFIFGIIGIGYCLSFVRTGKDWWGVIMAICVAVLTVGFYFFLLALFRAFAKEGYLPIILGAWGPNLIYGTVATILIYYQCVYR